MSATASCRAPSTISSLGQLLSHGNSSPVLESLLMLVFGSPLVPVTELPGPSVVGSIGSLVEVVGGVLLTLVSVVAPLPLSAVSLAPLPVPEPFTLKPGFS